MTNDPMSLDAIFKAATIANQQNDRWLFLAVLMLLGAFAIAALYYLIRENQKLVLSHEKTHQNFQANYEKLQREFQESLRSLITSQNETAKTVVAVLERNTIAMQENNELIRHFKYRES
jgi:uncharacterized protein HemX